jgi:hypothetical protein
VVTWEIKRDVQKGPKASSLVVERIIAISRCHLIRPQSWFSLGVNEGEKGVVESFPHSLSVRYGGSGKLSAREGPVYNFFQRSHVESSTS